MALIDCPECNNKVSDAAPTCPKCGVPIAGAKEGKAAGVQLTTIQATGKRLKVHTIFSSLLICIGTIWLLVTAGTMQEGDELSLVSTILIFVGFIWFIITRIRIWWHHR